MRIKFLALSLGLAVLLAGNMSSVANASWLSFHQVGQKRSSIVIIDLVRL